MKSSVVLGLLAAAAWFLYRNGYSKTRKVPVNEAAALLRAAWAKNHTLA